MPQDPAWKDEPTPARRLAAWTSLTADRFGEIYNGARPAGTARAWGLIALDVPEDLPVANPGALRLALIRAACDEAEKAGFLEELAWSVVEFDAESSNGSLQEIRALMGAVTRAGAPRGTMQAVVNMSAGFASAMALRNCVKVMEASAYVTDNTGLVIGTAVLIAPDRVLTAAHVAVESAPGGGWQAELRPGLQFRFKQSPTDPQAGDFVALASDSRPLALAPPFGPSPAMLSGNLNSPQAGASLDFAVIRLRQQVLNVPHLDIRAPGIPVVGPNCFVVGYPGGTAEATGIGPLVEYHAGSGRILHCANTAPGMSGACYVGSDGELIGLHEGTLPGAICPGNASYNRAVSLTSVLGHLQQRRLEHLLDPRPRAPGIGFEDQALGDELWLAGIGLAGPDFKASWIAMVRTLVGGDLTKGDAMPMPLFHPWFARGELESWIDRLAQRPQHRVLFVIGERGTGKSFAAHILRAKLDAPLDDLTLLRPTQANSWSWDQSISALAATEAIRARTRAGAVRYDDVPQVVAALATRGGAARTAATPHVVVIDFENAQAFRIDSGPWRAFIQALSCEPWARLVLIGLSANEQDAVETMLGNTPGAQDIECDVTVMRHVDNDELSGYITKLRKARNIEGTGAQSRKDIAALRSKVAALWQIDGVPVDLPAPLTTAAAAIHAMAFHRSATQPQEPQE